jgi:hypothetical protein
MDVVNGTILVLITVVVLPIAGIAFARSGPLWQNIGRGPLAIDEDLPRRSTGGPPPPLDPAIQAAEARQMLEAKSYRRERRGEASLDVEAEVARLLEPAAGAPSVDEELRAEVRRLVVSSNERRARRGEPRLNVEEETERQLADFIGSG